MPAMLILTIDSSKPFRRTHYVRTLITFPRFLISTLEFRRELGFNVMIFKDKYKVTLANTEQKKNLLKFLPLNPSPHMPILGSSNSATNKDIMSIILTNGDTIF